MANILKFFLPKDRVFYSLFEAAGVNLMQMSELLVQVMEESNYNEREVLIGKLEAFEHANDHITHQIFNELGRNFITPFDREDIHALAGALDDIADFMYASSKKINIYKVDSKKDTNLYPMAVIINKAVKSVCSSVAELRNLKNTAKIMESVRQINVLENEADELYDLSIEHLFQDENDAKKLIIMREIYQTMEEVTDKCEDAGNVIESIVVKYA